MTTVMTNTEFVKKLKNIATNYKTLYVMGCFGDLMTESNKERYCNHTKYNRQPERQRMIKAATSDTFGFDCVCLIKGVLWGWNGDKSKPYGGAKYKSNGVPDIGADEMITKCKNVSTDFSKIEVGEAVWCKGHIGVYVGNGLAVECTPSWENKVQITACNCTKAGYNRRNWTKHGKLPYIDYVKEEKKEEKLTTKPTGTTSKESFLPARGYFKKGDSGVEIHKICEFFANNYYSYLGNTKKTARVKLLGANGKGDYFGPNLYAWTKEFQRRTGLEQDGCIGPITLAMMKKFGFKEN